ncbi:MAG: hypothetical protein AAGD11_07850 [Planctomycetota bacterium]
MRHLALMIVVIASSLTCTLTFAQESNPRGYDIAVSRRYSPPEAIHRHSSTAYEGAMRGEAAWITAAGEFLVDDAQAEILWQHAESLHYENELKKTATALTRKKMLNDYRDYERQRRIDRKTRSKELWQAKYQELARTYRLNEFQFNWETGAIYWPALVSTPRYAQQRERLEVLLSRVVRDGETRYGFESEEIARVCLDFRNMLKDAAATDHPSMRQDYSDMQRFLLGLKYAPVLIQSGGPLPTLAMR